MDIEKLYEMLRKVMVGSSLLGVAGWFGNYLTNRLLFRRQVESLPFFRILFSFLAIRVQPVHRL